MRDEAAQEEPDTPAAAKAAAAVPPPPLLKPAPPVRVSDIVPPPGAFIPGASGNRPARIDELVVCSHKGEVLYEWQCANNTDRISFLEFLSQKSLQLGEGLNLGAFDRLEMEGAQTRVVAQVKADRGVFLRTTKGAARGGVDTK